MQKGTIAICFVHKALQPVRGRGLDVGAVLAASGIAPGLLELPQARVSAESYSALWRTVNDVLDDEFFGQDSRRMKVGSFAMLCHGLIHCKTLEQALHRTLRFFDLILDDLHAECRRSGDEARLTLHPRPGTDVRVFAHETLLIMLHGLMCWLVGRRVPIRVARFAYAEPDYSVEYHAMYSENLEFGRQHTEIVFDAAYLDVAVVQNEKSLKNFLRTAPQSVFLKYKNRQGLAARVRERLKSRPFTRWPGFDDLAAELHLAPSTLRRRLDEEGHSYQGIKDELRRDKAIDLLSHSNANVSEIAIALGFAEPSAFHRAFRKWTGAQPSAYRHTPGVRT
jgi:AraC-like DNA-binding protein